MEQRQDNEELFKVIKDFHAKEELPNVCAQHPHLLPKLRPYQEKAVEWMVYRETQSVLENAWLDSGEEMPALHIKRLPTGGILSDEMGLGKTVEVLACILINQRIDVKILSGEGSEQGDEDEEMMDVTEKIPKDPLITKRERDNRAKRRANSKEDSILSFSGASSSVEEEVPAKKWKSSSLKCESFNIGLSEFIQDDETDGKIEQPIVHGGQKDGIKRGSEVENLSKFYKKDVVEKGSQNEKIVESAATALKQEDDDIIIVKEGSSKESKVSGRESKSKTGKGESNKKAAMKSVAKRQAQEWYESKLLEVKQNPIRALYTSFEESEEYNKGIDVQCICGGTDELKLCKCSQCSRLLHRECIGASPWIRSKPVYCPQCWLKQAPVTSRATLIVSPRSISRQWLNEVKKHVSSEAKFKVLSYRGVKADGFQQPYYYSDCDIVLTTYDVLVRELDLTEVHEGRSMRYQKKYFTPTCPLLGVDFWRICLDEAQMVEGHATKAAEMVSRLSSVHRWAVTGTPIQKSFQDLYGLVLFLCVEPFCDISSWRTLLFNPYWNGNKNPFHTLFKYIMWRSSKADVLDQIQIPPQTELVWPLNFGPIEEHFYLRTHQECASDFRKKLSVFESLDIPLHSLSLRTVTSVLAPLLKLRQACSHPNAVRGNVITNQKSQLTMQELLESLIKKTTIEAQEALRKHIASLNGIAGLHVIAHEYVSAAENYRNVLRVAEEYKDRVKVDTLQKIHTLHNLAEIIESHRDVIPPTLRDEQINDECRKLEEHYLSKVHVSVTDVEKSLVDLTNVVNRCKRQTETEIDDENWWFHLCECLDQGEMLSRVHEALVNHNKSVPYVSSTSIINKVSNLGGLKLTCNLWLESLEKNELQARKSLQELKAADCETLVNKAVDCHLRVSNLKSKTVKPSCELCKCEDILKKYEINLFDMKTKKNENIMVGDVYLLGQGKEGSWQPSEQEKVLKTLLALGRSRKADKDILKAGSRFFTLMNALRKEFKSLRLLWSRINERVQALDELNMCKLRLRLRLPDEATSSSVPSPHKNRRKKQLNAAQLSSYLDTKSENFHIIDPHQVETMAHQNKLEAKSALSELRKKSGTVAYLQNLRKTEGDNSKSTLDVCPVCRSNLENKWAVLSCGHCYCIDCIRELLKQGVRCAVCRETTLINEVSFVNTCQHVDMVDIEESDASGTSALSVPPVEGSHSTKVEAIIRRLFYLKAKDPSVKVLIFSTWDRVLNALEEALNQNGVKSLRLKAGTHYEKTLKDFKDTEREDTVTALLLLLKLGSKGLNLIEATHIMMVEPLLNPAEELQAIGRVHRIGQTRPTFVHRFLIKNSIEDRMISAVEATGKEQWGEKKVTLRQLKDLFSISSTIVTDAGNDSH